MRRWPGVQGLRGAAVLAVLLYHHDASWLPGGFLGVSLFFTLSGFLITNLLLREREATGRTSLPAFWARRARRLMPVALVGLALATAVSPLVGTAEQLEQFSGDIVAAALDVANWRFAFADHGYGAAFEVTSPVNHYWSLSIEEQFYVLFPLVVILAATRRRLAVLLWAVVVASLAMQVAIDDPNRVYLGSDTRAMELAAGALLAVWWAKGRRPRPAVLDGIAAVVGLGVLAMWAVVDLATSALYDGGLAVVAASSVVLVLASVAGQRVPAVLGCRPLAVVGDHSYALYVVHLPLYLFLSPARVGVDGLALLGVRLLATAIVAGIVHVLVEEPVRVGRALPGWQARGAVVTGIAAVLIGGLALPDVPSARAGTEVSVLLSSRDTPTFIAAPNADVAAARARLLVVGDSTALTNGAAMQEWGAETGHFAADVVGVPGCALAYDGEVVWREAWQGPIDPGCPMLLDSATAVGRANAPDAVVVFVGSAQLADWILPGTNERTGIGDPMFDERYIAATDHALSRLEELGVPVLLATVPVPEWVPERTSPEAGRLGSGMPTLNDPIRTARLNELTAAVVERHPLVRLVPYAERLVRPDGTVDPALRPDGLHLSADAVAGALETWFEADLVAAYRDAVASNQLSSRPSGWTTIP